MNQLPFCVLAALVSAPLLASGQQLGNHPAKFDSDGILVPWTKPEDALKREMDWFDKCPMEGRYPRFVVVTFMDGDYKWNTHRPDNIPAMQNGMGILSYLKYYAFTGSHHAGYVKTAESMADYLVDDASTPDEGKYPRFPRSTGKVGTLPLPADCGSQDDHPFEVQPDKGAIVGHALVQLYAIDGKRKYLDAALHIARVLAQNIREGNSVQSPWPFRVDFRTGQTRGEVSADMSYPLRLFDDLLDLGFGEFLAPRDTVWDWIKRFQIPSAKKDGKLWVQFFEDYDLVNNRNSWSANNLIQYLVTRKDRIDKDWKEDASALVAFVAENFTSVRQGIPVCGEQDDDRDPWGGANSNYAAALAMYCAETGDRRYQSVAYQALTFGLYATDSDGCPGQSAEYPKRGGWVEDAHTDKIHSFVDAIVALRKLHQPHL
jgi:hypothetical protein